MEFDKETFQRFNLMGNVAVFSALKQFEATTDCSGLSIKMAISGSEHYRVDRDDYLLEPGSFLLVNNGQQVTCGIKSNSIVKGMCIYLEDEQYRSVLHSICHAEELSPSNDSKVPIPELISDVYQLGRKGLSQLLQQWASHKVNEEIGEEDFLELMEQLALHQLRQHRMMGRLAALQFGTKRELLRRLQMARNFIYDNYDKDIQLEDISRSSCLSKFHLLRSFRDVYQSTPYQSLLQRRVEVAKELLQKGESVQEVASCCGFNTRRSFSRVFKRSTGFTPNEFRKAHDSATSSFAHPHWQASKIA